MTAQFIGKYCSQLQSAAALINRRHQGQGANSHGTQYIPRDVLGPGLLLVRAAAGCCRLLLSANRRPAGQYIPRDILGPMGIQYWRRFSRPFFGHKESEFDMYEENKSCLELKNLLLCFSEFNCQINGFQCIGADFRGRF